MTNINLKNIVRRKDLNIQKIGEQFYLVTLDSCYEVNPIGATIVNAIGRDLCVAEIGSKLAQKYENNDVDQVIQDVTTFISFLQGEELVTLEQ